MRTAQERQVQITFVNLPPGTKVSQDTFKEEVTLTIPVTMKGKIRVLTAEAEQALDFSMTPAQAKVMKEDLENVYHRHLLLGGLLKEAKIV